MASEVEELQAKAEQLAQVASPRPEAERAARLAERLAARRFLVSFVGEFKRGKSTLINALLGTEVLPTGVLPLTAVATEVSYGERAAIVEHLDGARREIDPAGVGDYVTEERNPSNERAVARVEVRGSWPLLEPGVVLVDTPGIGSVYVHNTEAARAALIDADGAVLVLSADAPLSERERDLLRSLAERRAPTFFVLNKADHLTAGELDQVRRFVEAIVCDELGRKQRVFAVSARAALAARVADGKAGSDACELGDFVDAFERFIADDLVAARVATARWELARLGAGVRDALAIEEAAAALDAAQLDRLIEQFRTEASRQRAAFDDDRTLLARDVARLGDDLWCRLVAFARQAPAGHQQLLEDVAVRTPRSRLTDELRGAIEDAVRATFESFREAQADDIERAWRDLAEQFRAKTQQRVTAVRDAAADLFAISLPDVDVPPVGEQRERFFYLFLHVGGFNEPFGRVLARLLPDRVARRRAQARARAELAAEFDKHAGRARWDLTQRLDDVRRRFERAMAAELEDAIDGIVTAARRAAERRTGIEAERARWRDEVARQRAIASELAALAEDIE
jgi:ribosome biogenesis GTPase A